MDIEGQTIGSNPHQRLSILYLVWVLTHFYLFFSSHPLASMAPDKIFRIVLFADGQEERKDALARKDGKLQRSVISQRKATETQGATNTIPSPKTLKGAHDTTYDSQSSVTLRYGMHGAQRTFEETFFIVKDCQPDVILRHNIEKESLNSEPGFYPHYFGGRSKAQQDEEAAERAKREIEEDKLIALEDQKVVAQQEAQQRAQQRAQQEVQQMAQHQNKGKQATKA